VALLLVLGFLLILGLEVPAMRRRRQVRTLWAFWILWIIAFGVSLAVTAGWPAPNPTPVLESLFKPYADALGLK
jgi:hypothetical protein